MRIALLIFLLASALSVTSGQFLSPQSANIEPLLIDGNLRNLDLEVTWSFPFEVYNDGFYLEAKFAEDRLLESVIPSLQLSLNTDNDVYRKVFYLQSMHLKKSNFAFVRVCSVNDISEEVERNCTKSIRFPISKDAAEETDRNYRLLRTTPHAEDVTLTLYSSMEHNEVDVTIFCVGEGLYSAKLGKRAPEALEWRTVIGSEEKVSLSGLRPDTEYSCEIIGRESESTQIADVILNEIEFKTEKINVPSPPVPKLSTFVTSRYSINEKLSIFLQPAKMQSDISKYILIAYPVVPVYMGDEAITKPVVEQVTTENLNSQVEAISTKEAIPFILRTFLPAELPILHSFVEANTAAFKDDYCYYFVLALVSRKQMDAIGWNSTVDCIMLGVQSSTKLQKFIRYGGFFVASSIVCFMCLLTAICFKSIATIRKKLSGGGSKRKYTKVRTVTPETPPPEEPNYDYLRPVDDDDDD